MELVIILAAIFGFFLLSVYIRKRLSAKTNLIISLVGFIALISLYFARGLVQRFTPIQQIVFSSICYWIPVLFILQI